MENKKNKSSEKISEEIIVDDKKGISISYPEEQVKEHLPNIYRELARKEENLEISGYKHKSKLNSDAEELVSPGAVDFIRRCSTNEEAFEILDYLFNKKEISKEEYQDIKEKIENNGLDYFGEHKTWGYYARKYRNRK